MSSHARLGSMKVEIARAVPRSRCTPSCAQPSAQHESVRGGGANLLLHVWGRRRKLVPHVFLAATELWCIHSNAQSLDAALLCTTHNICSDL